MARGLFSLVGTLAMLIAFLPGVVGTSSAEAVPGCCNGVICPLHQMASTQVTCYLNLSSRAAEFQSCPDQTTHFVGALVFVRVAPTIFFTQRWVDSAVPLAFPAPDRITSEVPYPPPRPTPAD
jgi:hypothetical protein